MRQSRSFQVNRAVRVVAALAVMAAVAAWWPTPTGGAQSTEVPFELTGAGASEVQPLISALAITLFDGQRPLSLNYFARGDRDGRATLGRGEVSYAISGLPLSDEDKDALKERKVGVIEAPFALTSMAFLLSAPWGLRGGVPTDPNPIQYITFDPNDEDAPVILEDVPSPLPLTNAIVSNLFLKGSGPWGPDLNALVAPKVVPNPGASATRVARSDPGAMNYFLAEYLQHANRAEWDARAAVEGVVADEPTESWPFLNSVPTRAGDGQIGSSVGSWLNPDGGNASGGTLAPVSSATARLEFVKQMQLKAEGKPYTPLYLVGIQNGAGQTISPTPENMTRAAVLGKGKPAYGLTENVPDVYPLTWVEKIYVPNKGLAADEATGVATLMRFQATLGQLLEASLGEGILPEEQQEELWDAADEVIESNCTGSDVKVTLVSGGGQFWPKSLLEAAPDRVTICEEVDGTQPTTTVAPGATADVQGGSSDNPSSGGSSTPNFSSGNFSSPGSDVSTLASEEFDDAGPTGEVPVAVGDEVASGDPEQLAAVAAELPLPPPSDGRLALDRLATLLLGGAAFLLLRRVLGPRLAA